MASLKSAASAQSIAKCKLCEDEPNIKWKCVECEFLMCNKCRENIHSKFKHARNHTIVDIRDIGKEKDLKLIREFDTELNYCDFVAACPGGSLWIGDYLNGKIHKVQIKGTTLQRIQTIKSKLSGIKVFSKCKEILVADRSPTLKIIDHATGQISESKYNVGTLNIVSLHISSDKMVIVGAISPGQYFPVSGRRVVTMFDQDGHQQATFGRDTEGNRLFSVPFRITGTINQNIFVVDGLSDDGIGRVVVLNRNGYVKNVYHGIQSNNLSSRENQFKPVDLTSTPLDKVIICDLGGESFHILNNAGAPVSCVQGSAVGVSVPFSVDLLDGSTLFIGSVTTEVNGKAKLYEVEFREN